MKHHYASIFYFSSRKVDLPQEKKYDGSGFTRGSSTIPRKQNLEKEGKIVHLAEKNRINIVITNGILMALYLALTILVSPVASGPIQFRISESLNHLVVFNRKYLWGVLGGVIIYNAIFGMGILDVVFGGGQTLLALGMTALLQNKVKNIKIRLALNVLFFSVSMVLIAVMLYLTAALPFWITYAWLAASEAIIMTISAPLMYYLDQRLHFEKTV